MIRRKTSDAARGKWRGILLTLGVESAALTGKHAPCPLPSCGGKDRFRFTDREGAGSFVCSACGNGASGFEFLERWRGWDFATAAREVDAVIDNVEAEPIKPATDEATRRRRLNDLWRQASRIEAGDPVWNYLQGRDLIPPVSLDVLRYHSRCPAPDGNFYPAMLAKVQSPDGSPATLHRTFLGPNGKADMDEPRATMPGELPCGAAIRLGVIGPVLGIAEGIETAMAAAKRFGVVAWAAINATMLAKWEPPEGVEEVIIFGDHDATLTGHVAAYTLARRLRMRNKIKARVEIPPIEGTDWADAA